MMNKHRAAFRGDTVFCISAKGTQTVGNGYHCLFSLKAFACGNLRTAPQNCAGCFLNR